MPVKQQQYRWEFDIPLARAAVWRFVSDTERINRLAGLFNVHFEYDPLASGGSVVRASAKTMGMTLRWVERPCVWADPERMQFTRDYQSGPIARLISTTELTEVGPARTKVAQIMDVTPRGRLGALVSRFAVGVQTRKGFETAYGQAVAWAERDEHWPVLGSERPRASADTTRKLRRLLEPIGARTDAADLVDKLIGFLTTEPESEIGTIVPYRLADRWAAERGRVLRLLLRATEAGALDMHWNLICPSCRRSKALFESLAEVAAMGHCETCNIDFGAEFDRSVEVTFSPTPVGLGTQAAQYCHAGPRNTPHRVANLTVPAAEQRSVSVVLAAGMHQFKSPQAKGAVFVEVVEAVATDRADADARREPAPTGDLHAEAEAEAAPAPADAVPVNAAVPPDVAGAGREVVATAEASAAADAETAAEVDASEAITDATLTLRDGGVEGAPRRMRAGRVNVTVDNATAVDPAEFMIDRAAWADDSATAADVTALAEFRRLFGSELLAPGASFSIRTMVFLFTDLVGSTSMYEAIGDAAAFALVRDHFDLLLEICDAHDGAVVKTIGDAVMGVFRRPDSAVRAALEMHQRLGEMDRRDTGTALALRIGVHAGPCIAMEANGRLDYFGTTVNAAARIQATAAGGELAVSETVRRDPAVRTLLGARAQDKAVTLSIEKAQLKGLAGAVDVARVKVDSNRLRATAASDE